MIGLVSILHQNDGSRRDLLR